MFITIENNGPTLVPTKYWGTEFARKGFVYLSWNAGAGRLLVPESSTRFISEMRTGNYVIVSRGAWIDQGGREALELLFEDGSDCPYCLYVVAESTDRLPSYNESRGFEIAVHTRAGEHMRLTGKYRKVRALPCMEAWKSN